MRRSVRKGIRAEQDIARLLTQWARPHYTFRRRGLGHAGVADLVVTTHVGFVEWPFTISVKGGRGPTLPALLRGADSGRPWPWWAELEASHDSIAEVARLERGLSPGPSLEHYRARAWLIWRSSGAWLLSCSTLGGLAMPGRLALLPTRPGWPAFTMRLDRFLATVPIAAVLAAIADGWGQPE